MNKQQQNFSRREFLAASVTATAVLTMKQLSNAQTTTQFELSEATVFELQSQMQSGAKSAESIAEMYLKRIAEIDAGSAKLNSVVQTNIDALKIAKELDKERKAGKMRSNLHGIPVLLKDNIDTADKMPNTAGSLALLDNLPKADAFLVKRLREAGAVILGKTNLSEWANFRSTKSSSGWSARGGQTKNPYILERNPCGSSSGSGAAISANLAAIAIGTETDGSIVCPASNCGIVGLKPTVGLISRSGIIPISHTQDTAGPMTRNVADAAVMLNFLTGVDAADTATKTQKAERDYVQFLQKDGLKNARIGVARQFFGKSDKLDRRMENCLAAMKDQGATLVDVEFPTLEKFGDSEFEVLLFEFKAGLQKYLQTATTKYKTLQELIEFNEENRDREMPHFGQEIFLQAEKKGDLNDRAYRLALQKNSTLTRAQGIDAVMTKHKIDAVVAPTGGAAWLTDLVNGDCGSHYFGSSSLAAVAGYPSITVPAGLIDDLMPCGISFFGRAYSEATLLKLAYSFEQATKFRRTPKLLRNSGF